MSAVFQRTGLDVARYACGSCIENLLDIILKISIKSNDRFGFKVNMGCGAAKLKVTACGATVKERNLRIGIPTQSNGFGDAEQ